MALSYPVRHAATFLRQDYSSVFLMDDELFFSELVEHPYDGRWGYVEVFHEVYWSRLSFLTD